MVRKGIYLKCLYPKFFLQAFAKVSLCAFILGFIFLGFSPILRAADSSQKNSAQKVSGQKENSELKTISLKLMVVNPSKKFKQTFPLKSYLPDEVKPAHVVDKEDLEIGYDAEKKAYYLSKELELEPGESVLKSIKVQDIWFVPEDKLQGLSEEAHDIFSKLQGTPYEEQGRLLLSNVEVALVQIVERQSDESVDAATHISIYRDNKKKIYDIEMDLMSMRRFLAAAKGDGSFGMGKSAGKHLPKFLEDMAKRSSAGAVPASLLWKIIMMILVFLGVATFLFLSVWQQQLKKIILKAKENQLVLPKLFAKGKNEQPKMKIGDFYPGLSSDLPPEKPLDQENTGT